MLLTQWRHIVFLCGLLVGGAAIANEATPEMFGALPTVDDAEISPNGRVLATLRNTDDAALVVFRSLDDAQAKPRGTRIEGALPRALYWANDEILLVLVSQSRKRRVATGLEQLEVSRWLAISRQTMRAQVLFDHEPGLYLLSAGRLLATGTGEPNQVIFARWTSRAGRSDRSETGTRLGTSTGGGLALFALDLQNGSQRVIASGSPETEAWFTAADGKPLARVDRDSERLTIHSRGLDSADATRTVSVTGTETELEAFELVGVEAGSGRWLASTQVDGRRALAEYRLAEAKFGTVVFKHADYDVGTPIYDARIAAVRGVGYTDDLPRQTFFDPGEQRLQASLAAALPEASPLLWSRSADGQRYIVKVVYIDHPPQWFLYDKAAKALTMIGKTYEALDGQVFARKQKFDYTAADGLRIPGYLTVPGGAELRGLPLIVLPHGGPAARDDLAFDYWSAFYAARGYLVYQPNFRGSDGYGADFRAASHGEWGRKMQSDIDEGVRRLIADGRVDARRICIVGASFGGYAALVAATRGDELYACAVSVNGLSSVGDLLGEHDSPQRTYWEPRIGRRADLDKLHEISPLHRAQAANVPILLIHAEADTISPLGQSRAMAKALSRYAKPHELVVLDGEDHWLSRAATRTQMLARSIAFIDQHIGRAHD